MSVADSHGVHCIRNIIILKLQILYLSIGDGIIVAQSFPESSLDTELELQRKGIPKSQLQEASNPSPCPLVS